MAYLKWRTRSRRGGLLSSLDDIFMMNTTQQTQFVDRKLSFSACKKKVLLCVKWNRDCAVNAREALIAREKMH